MNRIILFGKSKRRTRTTYHLIRAFRERGHAILWLNPAKIKRRKKKGSEKWILKQIDAFDPDIVFIYSRDIPLEVLQRIAGSHIKTVMYHEDMSHELPPALVQWGSLVDYFLATNKGKLCEYRQAGIANPIYFTGACDRYDHRLRQPLLPFWKSDVAFIGKAGIDQPRITLTRKLAEVLNLKVYGKNWNAFGLKPTLKTITPRQYGLVCGGAKIILGADFTTEVEGYWSNRLWLTLGCGGFFITGYVRGMETYFENNKHLVWYHSFEECLSLAEEYLVRPEKRREIALQGYDLVHAHHTFHHFVDRVVSLCTRGSFESGTRNPNGMAR